MYTCGIDVGSVSTEVVILGRKDNKIASYIITSTGSNSKEAAKKALDNACKKDNISGDSIKAIVATGYGRINIPFADQILKKIHIYKIIYKQIRF